MPSRVRGPQAGACLPWARRRCERSNPRPPAARSAGQGETSLFILPGYRFRVVDRLLTNFHLPRSTLLMLVSAFGGMDNIREAYRHVIEERYRFFSYGDAMLIEQQDPPSFHLKFDVLATDGLARRGVMTLPHGRVDTPAFMPVGTSAP